MSDQKTEAPTQRRLDEARRKGESVGRSHELAMALTLGAGTMMLSAILPGAGAALAASLTTALREVGQPGLTDALAVSRLGDGIAQAMLLVLPLGVIVALAGVGANLASGGLVFSTGSIRVDPNRLNPIAGLRRIADRQALVRLLIAAVKLALLATVSWNVVSERVPAMVATDGAGIASIARVALDAIFQLGLVLTMLLLGVALTDFVIQRRRAIGALKMSKDEVKREYRDSEGDPHILAQRRRRARQLAFNRMMSAVPGADVVVTNPTHLAIALKYDPTSMRAPQIVAKGQRLMAQRIKDLARANGVPVIEDVPLARLLFPRPIGSEVPPHLYRAVARILILVQQAKRGVRMAQPAALSAGPIANPFANPTTDAGSAR